MVEVFMTIPGKLDQCFPILQTSVTCLINVRVWIRNELRLFVKNLSFLHGKFTYISLSLVQDLQLIITRDFQGN